MAHKALSDDQIQWAYRKWCEGYTKDKIAKALFVCERTLYRALQGKRKEKLESRSNT